MIIGDKMKAIYKLGVMLTLFSILYLTREDIIKWLSIYVIKNDEVFILSSKNDYTKNTSIQYVRQVNQFIPKNMSDLKNIYYSILNSGEKSYSFYCPKEYTSCIDDVKTLANDQVVLSNLNNFVHPFNSFKNIETEYDSFRKVTITYYPVYKESDIATLSKKIEENADYDAFCVFDADNIVDPNFIKNMNKKLCQGEEVEQGYRDIKNPDD